MAGLRPGALCGDVQCHRRDRDGAAPTYAAQPPLRIAGIRGRAWAVFVLLFLLFGNGPPLRAQDAPVELRDYTHDSCPPP